MKSLNNTKKQIRDSTLFSGKNKFDLIKSSSTSHIIIPNYNFYSSKRELKEKNNSLPKISLSTKTCRDNNNINDNDENKIKLEEELNIIKNMWKDLGVTGKYKLEFYNYLRNCNDDEKNELFKCEKKYLKNFRDSLLKFSKDVYIRENNILNLKKL